jgi:hypothetical protein
LFLSDLLTGHEPIKIKIRIKSRKGRFMGSPLGADAMLTGHEPIKIKIRRGKFMGSSETLLLADVAAPEDGRTPQVPALDIRPQPDSVAPVSEPWTSRL